MAYELGRGTEMPSKRHKPEEIVAKLRQVDVLTSQRSVGGRVHPLDRRHRGDHHRELAQTLQCGAPARLAGISATRARGARAGTCRVAGGASWVGFAGHAPAGAK